MSKTNWDGAEKPTIKIGNIILNMLLKEWIDSSRPQCHKSTEVGSKTIYIYVSRDKN